MTRLWKHYFRLTECQVFIPRPHGTLQLYLLNCAEKWVIVHACHCLCKILHMLLRKSSNRRLLYQNNFPNLRASYYMHQKEIAVCVKPVRAKLTCRKWSQSSFGYVLWWCCWCVLLTPSLSSFLNCLEPSKIYIFNQCLQFIFPEIRVRLKQSQISLPLTTWQGLAQTLLVIHKC